MFCDGKQFHSPSRMHGKCLWPPIERVKTFQLQPLLLRGHIIILKHIFEVENF